MTRGALLSGLSLLALAACAEDEKLDPVKACNDLRTSYAKRVVDDCGQVDTYDEVYASFDSGLTRAGAEGGCADADGVKDDSSFTGDCLPGVKALTCDELAAGQLPRACVGQILFVQ